MKTTSRLGTASCAVCGLATALSLTVAVEATAADASQLAAKYNCQACHAVDKKLVGPGYKEIAAKYAGNTAAPAKLEQKVKTGGSGVWGAIPMPPNNIPDTDLKTLVTWILSLK